MKPSSRRSRRNQADAPNPAPLIPPRFEHEHDDAVATLWRALARAGRDVGLAKSGRGRLVRRSLGEGGGRLVADFGVSFSRTLRRGKTQIVL